MFKFVKKNKIVNKIKNKYPRKTKFIREVFNILGEKEVRLLAPYIAFFILLCFIPIITLIFEVVYLTVNNNREVLSTLKDVLPSHVYTVLDKLIGHNSGHISILTITNIILLFVASQIYLSFYTSYLLIYDVKARPHYIKDRIIAMINTILLILLIFFLSMITVFNNYLYKFLEIYIVNFTVISYLFNYINLVLSIMIISSIVTFMMYSIPDIRQRVKDVIQGALFVTFGWILVSFGFKIYTDQFVNYQTVYKTFASVIVFVTWIYLLSYVLIIGIVINRAKITTYEMNETTKNINEYTGGSEY
ncbi:YihY/virulence factor BrkB family protein [Mycoplasmatota bacterium]|nr:YihY/virulence factor BrkB family protein [Mycoplasmatota bacterium]